MKNQQQDLDICLVKARYESGESLNSLSKEYKINIGTLRYKLIKSGVKIRNVKESVKSFFNKSKLILSENFINTIIGLILGDGSLRLGKNYKNPIFIYTDKHKEVIEYIINIFETEGIKCSSINYNKHNNCYRFQTEAREEFLDYFIQNLL